MAKQSPRWSRLAKVSVGLVAAALVLTACGGDDDSGTGGVDPTGVSEDSSSDRSDQGEADSSGAEFVEAEPFAALSAMANLPHGVGPVGVAGECSATRGSYQFSSSGNDRFQLVIFDGSPPTVESALAFLGTKTYTFTEIDSVEVGPDRYFVSGAGAETGREAEAGPMSFTILCRN